MTISHKPIFCPYFCQSGIRTLAKKRLYLARIFAKLHFYKELAALHSICSSSVYKGKQKHTQETQTHTHQDAGFFLKRNFQMDMTPLWGKKFLVFMIKPLWLRWPTPLKVPKSTCKYPEIPISTQKYLRKTKEYLKVLKSTSKYSEVPQSTSKYQKVPRSTSKY